MTLRFLCRNPKVVSTSITVDAGWDGALAEKRKPNEQADVDMYVHLHEPISKAVTIKRRPGCGTGR
jgi:hypothetical protein